MDTAYYLKYLQVTDWWMINKYKIEMENMEYSIYWANEVGGDDEIVLVTVALSHEWLHHTKRHNPRIRFFRCTHLPVANFDGDGTMAFINFSSFFRRFQFCANSSFEHAHSTHYREKNIEILNVTDTFVRRHIRPGIYYWRRCRGKAFSRIFILWTIGWQLDCDRFGNRAKESNRRRQTQLEWDELSPNSIFEVESYAKWLLCVECSASMRLRWNKSIEIMHH